MIHVRILARSAGVALLLLAAASARGQDYEKAMLRVFLPTDDAKLEIQGRLSKKMGAVRYFESPLLPPGKSFNYDLKVTWMENGKAMVRERTTRVIGGQWTDVDLRIADKAV